MAACEIRRAKQTSCMYLVQRCDTLFLCTSARSKEGAGVANDRANLDCIGFTALYMATFSKLDVADVYTMRREGQKSKAEDRPSSDRQQSSCRAALPSRVRFEKCRNGESEVAILRM